MSDLVSGAEVQVWKSYPSWAHFTWLYFFSLMAALRALLYLRFDLEGWQTWFVGAGLLLLAAVAVRRWVENVVTSKRVLLRSGYTGKEIHSISLENVEEVSIRQGPIAGFFDIGTVVVRSVGGEMTVSLRGVRDPEIVKRRIEALSPAPPNGLAYQ